MIAKKRSYSGKQFPKKRSLALFTPMPAGDIPTHPVTESRDYYERLHSLDELVCLRRVNYNADPFNFTGETFSRTNASAAPLLPKRIRSTYKLTPILLDSARIAHLGAAAHCSNPR